ncbi:helix-turn-helix transcriptional regulator [Arthrobacter alpinus]|nr:helix-turn-helix transcriptional regulator [Arthrobacter alpinus]
MFIWSDAVAPELRHALHAAHVATAHRDHPRACAHLETALQLFVQDPASPIRELDLILELARSRFRAGNIASSWAAGNTVADIARESGDGLAMADAAVVLHGIMAPDVQAQVHALCIEALALVGNKDPLRHNRLRSQLAATSSIWVGESYFDLSPDSAVPFLSPEDPEGAFLALLAAHAQYLGCAHVRDRLELADAAVALGRQEGNDEYHAWGLLWRIEALLQLGQLVEVSAEFLVLTSVAERLREVLWSCRIELLHGVLLHLEGKYDEALVHTERAREISQNSGDEAVAFVHLVMSISIAIVTGEGLALAEEAVRHRLDGLPYSAKGWLVAVLAASGKNEEAKALWKAVAPHIHEFPRRAPEWIIANATNAQMCVQFRDHATAEILYLELLPFEGLLASADAQTPSSAPVAHYLGLLARLLGKTAAAEQHFHNALQLAESINAAPFAALARQELARPGTGERSLSNREAEITAFVATGQTNRSIAQALFLSERTVEHHVSNILRKLELPSRSAIAAWQASQ